MPKKFTSIEKTCHILTSIVSISLISYLFANLKTFAAVSTSENSTKQTNSNILAQSTQSKDTLVIPGERFGLVDRYTKRQDLVKWYGESNLSDTTLERGEGDSQFLATQVNLDGNRSFTVLWTDASRSQPFSVFTEEPNSAWKTSEGISVGIPLNKLRQILGKFQIIGIGWDYGNTILLQGTQLSKYRGKLYLEIAIDDNVAQKFPQDYQAVSGDRQVSADDPHWQNLGAKLGYMEIYLNSDF